MVKKNKEDSEVYVRLDSISASGAKRGLLEAAESMIHLQMISEKLKKFHKEEISGRNNAKKELKLMISEVNQLIESMPKVKMEKPVVEKIEIHEEMQDKPKIVRAAPKKAIEKKTLNQELADIRKRIESLKK